MTAERGTIGRGHQGPRAQTVEGPQDFLHQRVGARRRQVDIHQRPPPGHGGALPVTEAAKSPAPCNGDSPARPGGHHLRTSGYSTQSPRDNRRNFLMFRRVAELRADADQSARRAGTT